LLKKVTFSLFPTFLEKLVKAKKYGTYFFEAVGNSRQKKSFSFSLNIEFLGL
jgi:hypothetical protein